MRRSPILVLLAALSVAGCSADSGPPPPFSEVDPYTSGYFIALDDTGLAASQGEERLYNLGVNSCSFFDRGDTFAREWAALAVESNLGIEPAGRLIVSAVQNLCPQHEDALEEFTSRGAESDAELAREACALDPEFDPVACR